MLAVRATSNASRRLRSQRHPVVSNESKGRNKSIKCELGKFPRNANIVNFYPRLLQELTMKGEHFLPIGFCVRREDNFIYHWMRKSSRPIGGLTSE